MMLNPFNNDAFGLVQMTESINIFPNMYGMIQKMGLFADVGIRTTTALIERRNGILTLIPSVPQGGAPAVNVSAKRDLVAIPMPHIPLTDMILPNDVQGLRAFGTENVLETIDNLMAVRLAEMSRKHDITLEYLRMGALKGMVIDGDGSTVLANLFSVFGVTQKVINIAFGTATTDIAGAMVGIKRYFEDNLHGETMSSVYVLSSPEFWDALISHPKVQAAYLYWINAMGISPLRDDLRLGGFTFQGVTFVEYRGQASLPGVGGTSLKFIPPYEAIAIPLGTTNVFKTYYAPANFNETVNTIGLPKYAKQQERDFQQGWDLWTESNPLPIATRPDLIVRVTLT